MRLRYKLFLVILLANLLLSAVFVAANNRAFNAGFATYVSESQRQRLEPLTELLAEAWEEQGGWAWLQAEGQQWQTLQQPFMRPRRERGPGGFGRRGMPELQVRDRDGTPIVGAAENPAQMTWLPIMSGDERVGELGFPDQMRVFTEFDQLFAAGQRQQTRWIALMALVLSAAISIPAAALLVRPISRLKQATHELADGHYDVQLPAKGSDELAELARDFNRLALVLKDNLMSRQRWIADISHELRTPVAVLKAELEALIDGVRTADAQALNSLHQEAERLNRLVDDLHQLSLSDAGALTYQFAPLDLVALLKSEVAQYEATLARNHLALHWRLPAGPVLVNGDARRLTQMIVNLLQNSLRYTAGSADAPGQIDVGLERLPSPSDRVQLLWSDSAPGVPDAELPRLFERLHRVEGSRSRATGGSGLGLAIVANVAQAHGGQVSARHAELGGVTIEIQLPLYQERP